MKRDRDSGQPITEAQQREHDARRRLLAARRMLKIKQARDSLIDFTELTMPDPEAPEDVTRSRYSTQYFHRALAAALEEVEAGRMPRLIVTFPPRHGKSELTSRRFPAWFLGRDPYRHLMFATYNQPFAEDFGRDVRAILQSDTYSHVFPKTSLRKGEAASDRLKTEEGGLAVFVGRGGSSTGRGADCLIIDDPLKDRAEADSDTTRAELWNWFNDTMSTRLMSDTGSIIIIQTRWHDDDLVGRLTDPENPCYNRAEAARWKVINIPAIAEEDDVLGRAPGEALWPQRFGIDHLESFRLRNPKGFASLYQQRPTPEDGDLFTKDMIITYRRHQLPDRLRIYAASDHAVKAKQDSDRTCMIVVGVDGQGVMWLLDCWWKREKTNVQTEALLDLGEQWKPTIWWAGRDHITGSIGPFLKQRMREREIWVNIVELPEKGDKVQKAQAIIARARQGMVRFPADAPWLEQAKSELLKFPSARHDDFVDALANIGRGLNRQVRAGKGKAPEKRPAVGTMGWVKQDAAYRRRREQAEERLGGM